MRAPRRSTPACSPLPRSSASERRVYSCGTGYSGHLEERTRPDGRRCRPWHSRGICVARHSVRFSIRFMCGAPRTATPESRPALHLQYPDETPTGVWRVSVLPSTTEHGASPSPALTRTTVTHESLTLRSGHYSVAVQAAQLSTAVDVCRALDPVPSKLKSRPFRNDDTCRAKMRPIECAMTRRM